MTRRLKKRSQFGRNSIIAGLGMSLIAFFIYKFVRWNFLYQSYQEILGFGLIAIIIGIIYIFFGKKINS